MNKTKRTFLTIGLTVYAVVLSVLILKSLYTIYLKPPALSQSQVPVLAVEQMNGVIAKLDKRATPSAALIPTNTSQVRYGKQEPFQ